MKLDYWSASRLNMHEKCGEQFRRRYIEGEIIAPDLGQVRGRATHRSVEANMKAHIETGEYLELEAVGQAASDALDAELKGEFSLGADYEELGEKGAKDRVKDEVIGLSALHALKVAPTFKPQAIELRFELPEGALPTPLVGVIDLVDDGRHIRDAKTKQKSPNADEADGATQLTIYELGYQALKGEPSEGQILDHLIRTPKRGDLKFVTQVTHRTDEDLAKVVHRLEVANDAVDKEVFLPAPESAWWCDARYCGYARSCPFFRGRPRPRS